MSTTYLIGCLCIFPFIFHIQNKMSKTLPYEHIPKRRHLLIEFDREPGTSTVSRGSTSSPMSSRSEISCSVAWHTVHATEIEIDQSELSTRGKLSFPTSEGERTRGTRLSPVQSSIVFVYVRLPAMSAIPSTPVILVRFTFIYMNAGKQVLISMQL